MYSLFLRLTFLSTKLWVFSCKYPGFLVQGKLVSPFTLLLMVILFCLNLLLLVLMHNQFVHLSQIHLKPTSSAWSCTGLMFIWLCSLPACLIIYSSLSGASEQLENYNSKGELESQTFSWSSRRVSKALWMTTVVPPWHRSPLCCLSPGSTARTIAPNMFPIRWLESQDCRLALKYNFWVYIWFGFISPSSSDCMERGRRTHSSTQLEPWGA